MQLVVGYVELEMGGTCKFSDGVLGLEVRAEGHVITVTISV